MAQTEIDVVVAVVDDAREIVVVESVVFNPDGCALFDEINLDGAVAHCPFDVVGDIVSAPSVVVVVIDPVARSARIAIGVAQEADFRVGGVINSSVPFRRDVHIALPSSFERVSDFVVIVPEEVATRKRHGQHCQECDGPECVQFFHLFNLLFVKGSTSSFQFSAAKLRYFGRPAKRFSIIFHRKIPTNDVKIPNKH